MFFVILRLGFYVTPLQSLPIDDGTFESRKYIVSILSPLTCTVYQMILSLSECSIDVHGVNAGDLQTGW